ncbi:hypothetical protein LTR53_005937 [Teratosphaeriaceae sp. CCFEE 6253]|nr:hypothetical protein LTR53_005937 [Teratosphaeriaceae sp. CCFEE 6253]
MSANEAESMDVDRESSGLSSPPRDAESPEPTDIFVQQSESDRAQLRLIAKYGSIEAVDEEKVRRRHTYYDQYVAYKEQTAENQLVGEHVRDRNAIWNQVRAQKEDELKAARARVQELEHELEVNGQAQAAFNAGPLAPKAAAWDGLKEVVEKWEGFFALKVDEVPT